MAGQSQVWTLQDINESTPVVRLRLSQASQLLASQKPTLPGFLNRAKQYVENIFIKVEDEMRLETEPTKEATERNLKRIDKIFDSMVGKTNDLREETKEYAKGLSAEQQEDLITFWSHVQEFFNDLFKWLQDVFRTVVEKIKQGFRVASDAVKGVFDIVMNYLKAIF